MKKTIVAVFFAVLLLAGYAYAGKFKDNGNGTVTDKKTGLIWQKHDDGHIYNWFEAAGVRDARFNPAQKSVCGDLKLGGHKDWRLPTKDELLCIVDTSVPAPGPTIDVAYFPDTRPSVYWSSSTNGTGAAYGVVFRDGNLFIGSKGYNSWHVRCVRGGRR